MRTIIIVSCCHVGGEKLSVMAKTGKPLLHHAVDLANQMEGADVVVLTKGDAAAKRVPPGTYRVLAHRDSTTKAGFAKVIREFSADEDYDVLVSLASYEPMIHPTDLLRLSQASFSTGFCSALYTRLPNDGGMHYVRAYVTDRDDKTYRGKCLEATCWNGREQHPAISSWLTTKAEAGRLLNACAIPAAMLDDVFFSESDADREPVDECWSAKKPIVAVRAKATETPGWPEPITCRDVASYLLFADHVKRNGPTIGSAT